jgi:ADP-ribosylglycohydrolase
VKKCYESAKKSYPSEANGALMRITPMAAFCSKLNNEKDVEAAVIADVRMTHPGPTNEDACIAYCLAIRFIARYVKFRIKYSFRVLGSSLYLII